MRNKVALPVAVVVLAGFIACGSADATGSSAMAAPVAAAAKVYVADFDLDANSIQQSGPGSTLNRVRPGIIGSGPLAVGRTPQEQARDLVDVMSSSIVDDLRQRGIAAERLAPSAPLPSLGWLVRGAFLQVDAGNRLRRATIGFGSGSTDIQVIASVDELSAGPPQPLYTIDAGAQSGKLPGAVVTLNPYVAAARFVMAGHDLDRNAKATAEKIADLAATRISAPR